MPLKYELLELDKEGKATVEIPLEDADREHLATLLRTKHSLAATIKALEAQKEKIGLDLAAYHAQWEENTQGFLAGMPVTKVAFYIRDILDSDDKPDTVLLLIQSKGADTLSAQKLLELGISLDIIQQATVPGKLHNPYVQDYPQKPKLGGE